MKPFTWPDTVMIGVEGGYQGDELFVSDCKLEDENHRLYVSPAALQRARDYATDIEIALTAGAKKVRPESDPARLTLDEWNEILAGFITWARILRRRYLREECDSCGATYHPTDGPPPKEDEREGSWCGHAHFREMWGYWDEEAQDYAD